MLKKKVLHISPTYFSEDSVLGGGERFAWELAKAMAKEAEVTFLSFGKKDCEYTVEGVRFIIIKPYGYVGGNILNPIPRGIFKHIIRNDIVHVHQIFTVLTEVSILITKLLKKSIVLTDHGGGGRTFLLKFGLAKLADALLCVSNYSSNQLQHLHSKRKIIWGGVDLEAFPQATTAKKEGIVTCGRILPHKGHHHLINAIGENSLTIVGRISDKEYINELKKLAEGKNVKFVHDADDNTMKEIILKSQLAVFASTNKDQKGKLINGHPELLGISPLESMAMNVPTLVSNIGAYPEIALNENFIFKHDDISELAAKIEKLLHTPQQPDYFRNHVKKKYTWDLTAKRCLSIYSELDQ